MKTSSLLSLSFSILSFSCTNQPQGPSADTSVVEVAARRFVDLAHNFDYVALRAAATTDYEMLFDGRRMDLDDFEALLRGMEERRGGRKLGSYDLEDFNTEIVGDIAYTSWSSTNWLESMTFVWSGDQWLADRAFSIPVNADEP